MIRVGSRGGFRLTGWHVLGLCVAFFGVTVLVDAVMVMDAYATYPGEVSSSPYEDGLAYDSELGQQHAQAALGWRLAAGLDNHGGLTLTAMDRNGAPVELGRIDARLERPATEHGKRSISFLRTGPGAYRAEVGPLAGAWDVRFEAYDLTGRRFDAERRLIAR